MGSRATLGTPTSSSVGSQLRVASKAPVAVATNSDMSTRRTAERALLFSAVADWRRERLIAAGFAADLAVRSPRTARSTCTPCSSSSIAAAGPRWPRASSRPWTIVAGRAERVAVSDGVSVADTFVGGGIAMPEASLSVDGHAADAESRGWIEALSSTGAEREDAVARLHGVLVRASRFEVARRRRALGGGSAGHLDDLAMQAAADALVAILRKLHTFRDDSRFTTWA